MTERLQQAASRAGIREGPAFPIHLTRDDANASDPGVQAKERWIGLGLSPIGAINTDHVGRRGRRIEVKVAEQTVGEKRWQIGRRLKVAMIRDVAVSQFCHQGYANTSLQDIAKLADLHKATLYHYFESKELLLSHILDYAHDQISEIIDRVRGLDVAPVARLHALLEEQMCWYLDNIELARVTFHEWTNVGQELIEAQTERRRVYDRYLRSLIRAVQDEGYLPGENVALIANYVIGAMNAAPAWYAKDGSLPPGEVARIYADLSLRTLGLIKDQP